ncbi:unnamed protein product [Agarophyton chilense]
MQPSNVGSIEIFADGTCASIGKGSACGYGLVCDEPHARIAEPVPDSHQSKDRSYLYALFAALQFAGGVRSRDVTIYLADQETVHFFNNLLHKWMARDFRRYKGNRLPHPQMWKTIYLTSAHFSDRGVDLNVEFMKRKSEKMREAQSLAMRGTRMHVVCPLCKRMHGRQFSSHDCEPLCNYDRCNNKRFKSAAEYQDHLDMWHLRDCPSPECEEGLGIYSDKELRHHLHEVHGKVCGCDFCGRLFGCHVKLQKHVMKCPQGERCRDCGLRFKTRREANIHREKVTHGGFDDGDEEYESEGTTSSSSSSSTTTSSFSSDDDILTFATSRYR